MPLSRALTRVAPIVPWLIPLTGMLAIAGVSGWIVPPIVGAVCKPMTTLLIGVYAAARPCDDPVRRRLIFAGLFVSILGEIALSMPSTFVVGAVFFALAQCCYIGVSVRAIGVLRPGLVHAVNAVVVTWAIGLWSVRPTAVFAAVSVFLVLLGLMSAQAESWWIRSRGLPDAAVARSAAIGGLFWLNADMTLTFSQFVRWIPGTYAIVVASYFVAQWCLTSMIDAQARAGRVAEPVVAELA